MKFNLFLLLLATLLAVGSPQETPKFQIQQVDTGLYWAMGDSNENCCHDKIQLKEQGTWWRATTNDDQFYNIHPIENSSIAVTYDKANKPLIIKSASTTSGSHLWEILPKLKYEVEVAIQSYDDRDSFANPDSQGKYVNAGYSPTPIWKFRKALASMRPIP